jgi:hypothetical protein
MKQINKVVKLYDDSKIEFGMLKFLNWLNDGFENE